MFRLPRTAAILSVLALAVMIGPPACSQTPANADHEQQESADKKNPAQLTVDRIYGKSEFRAKSFGSRWRTSSLSAFPQFGDDYLKTEDSQQLPGTRDIVAYDALTETRTVLVPGSRFIPDDESDPLKIESYTFSADDSLVLIYTNSKRVWRTKSRGDYWLLDRSSHALRKLAAHAKPSTTQFAKISPDATKVAYVVDGNIFVEDVRSGEVVQVTSKPSDKIINGTFDWVYEEEFSLRDGFRWSPDSQRIAFWQLDTTDVPVFTMINNTDSMYPKLIQFAHPKTGQRNSRCRIGVTLANGKGVTWIKTGDSQENYIARMEWAENFDELIIQQPNRLQNTNRVLLADARQGTTRTILTETDDAWVDIRDDMHWLKDGREFTWTSERDGWNHLYVVSRHGKETRLLTPGNFDVISVDKVDEAAGCVYFSASPGNATQKYLYRAQLDGSGVTRVTPEDDFEGTNSYDISGNGKLAIHTHSSAGAPPTIRLVKLPNHELVRELEDNSKLKDKLEKLDRAPVEMFTVTANGHEMDAWCIKPPNLEAGKKYPLLFYVYGEPAGATVRDSWGGSTYLWHTMLAQHGYIVMSIDNRGTKVPKGRDWRKSIYRKVGIIAPQDQAAALNQLMADRPYIDPERVGIWGWSGGGSMALNAIFKYPELYKTAISIAPVPNQRYYDTIYQERYMGLPSDNVEGYTQGSPINFAHQLKGDLLLIHGTGDDNCHYQTMEMLINELIRHNKPFDMMAYPNRTHSIREGRNTSRHLRELMTRFLLEKL